ncbi:ligase-associated DNA damage response endonuclease PdeM [Dichotomicrobium thermohalophilum]|uniref:ligase-associated DNA damage response endonuclease PdeM n=1 Tax=Dichotomicrobium thermohalophilum TaxID=933063 RepID=UPI00147319FE|nr:ligase-associated DNA damage response endonuclease PdeM [Dichotomicrobium thermohalophilum]
MPRPAEAVSDRTRSQIAFAGVPLVLDARGGAYLPEADTLIVSDLHLEKGSYYAARGVPVPVCDTRETLRRLAEIVAAYSPARVVCLGDSFHDRSARGRLSSADQAGLADIAKDISDWVWVNGNHDPEPPDGLTGRGAARLDLAGLTLAHQPVEAPGAQIIGHYHPKLKLRLKGHKITGPCFVAGAKRLVMPAFGAFTGGLRVTRDAPWPDLLGTDWRQYLIFNDQLWPVSL